MQGGPGQESAGYHGYWITDFTTVDPHFGTERELQAFIEAAHARGMKVYLDIITNHTADVIQYRECPGAPCPYRSRARLSLYAPRAAWRASAINPGFAGDAAEQQNAGNFAKLTRPDYAYTPFVPAAEARIKVPAWLNEPIYYHNRGNSDFLGRELDAGRLRRPRRSDDREPARRAGLHRHLRRLDRPISRSTAFASIPRDT